MENNWNSLHLNGGRLFESRAENVALKIRVQLELLCESIKGLERVGDIGSVDFDLQVAAEQRELLLVLKRFVFLLILFFLAIVLLLIIVAASVTATVFILRFSLVGLVFTTALVLLDYRK